ncbi:hypothetical protein O9G_006395, partial [Rozella allomycis CSF55]
MRDSVDIEIENILNGKYGVKVEELTEVDQRVPSVHEADIVDYNNEVERVETFKNLLIDLINRNRPDGDLELELANIMSQRSSSPVESTKDTLKTLLIDLINQPISEEDLEMELANLIIHRISSFSSVDLNPPRRLSTSSAPVSGINYHQPTRNIAPVQSG